MKSSFKFTNITNHYIFIFFILYLTVLLGIYFNEDNLGGAAHDSVYHFKIVQKFNENFFHTFLNFGEQEFGLDTRNSPIFWAFMSLFSKFLSFDSIRILNSLIIFATAIVFYKCLVLKFKSFNHFSLIILTSMIFLSPSLRSLGLVALQFKLGTFFFYSINLLFLKVSK